MKPFRPQCRILLLVGVGLAAAARAQERDDALFPTQGWQEKSPAEVDLDEAKLRAAREYALTGEGSGYITRQGYLVMKWGDSQQRYDLKSTTKSFGATALGVAILDGKIQLDDPAVKHQPGLGLPPAGSKKSRFGTWRRRPPVSRSREATRGWSLSREQNGSTATAARTGWPNA
jgi:CubicO group peptidase (beta-lactamase class C family)